MPYPDDNLNRYCLADPEEIIQEINLSSDRKIICGIYKVLSLKNKVYIGQSRDIIKRFYAYSKYYCTKQKKLFSSLMSSGAPYHIYSIVHELPTDVSQEVLNNYEILYMERYAECGANLMNLRGGGNRGLLTPEIIEKIRLSHIGKKLSPEHRRIVSLHNKSRKDTPAQLLACSKGGKGNIGRKNSKEIIEKMRKVRPNNMALLCYDSNGNLVGEFTSQTDCARKLNLNQTNISMCILGLRPHHKGYTFTKK